MGRHTTAVTVLCAILLTGCGGTVVSEVFTDVGRAIEEGCLAAVSSAADIDTTQDTVEDLDEAIAACPSLFDLEAAAGLYPDAFDGANVRDVVRTRCAANEELTDGAVCREIAQ